MILWVKGPAMTTDHPAKFGGSDITLLVCEVTTKSKIKTLKTFLAVESEEGNESGYIYICIYVYIYIHVYV